MNSDPGFELDDKWIKSKRDTKNSVDPYQPYGRVVEEERTISGKIERVGTIFLTNRECPFNCLMCDLWKNTTNEQVPQGAVARQISDSLVDFSGIRHLKLYNSGNFFDPKAIPESDIPTISALVKDFETLLVESHPKLINAKCIDFKEVLSPELQVAMGLETVNEEILQRLNKRMNLSDFENAAVFLQSNGIPMRAFILLRPPFLNEEEGIFWAKRSIEYAFENGVECCVVIPTRAGNGAMDWLQQNDYFNLPSIEALEEVVEYGIGLKAGRVFADLWDLHAFSSCESCFDNRRERLNYLNLQQETLPKIQCNCK
jgi:radical SAM enzyme (TIGR01210 family)